MKKLLLLLLCVPLIFSCGGNEKDNKIKKLENRIDKLEKIIPKKERELSDRSFYKKEESKIQSRTYYEGEQIFKNVCIACHSLPGGGMLVGPDLKDVLTHDIFVNTVNPVATFIQYTQNPKEFGTIMMPPQDLNDEEVLSVLEFINTYIPEETESVFNDKTEIDNY
jgi:cytochrome c551/c552